MQFSADILTTPSRNGQTPTDVDEVNKMKKRKHRLTLEVDMILVSMIERVRVKELVTKTSNDMIDEALYESGRISDSDIFRVSKAKRKSPERNQIRSLISLQINAQGSVQVLVLLPYTPIALHTYSITHLLNTSITNLSLPRTTLNAFCMECKRMVDSFSEFEIFITTTELLVEVICYGCGYAVAISYKM
uniref:Uncharacterized protein n=1 Tax=Glossina pallidipes TaxID=7398 RepID=A0A1A9ZWY8_GLOPL